MRTPTPLSVPMLRTSAMALMAGLLTAATALAQQPAAPAPAAAPQAAAGCPAILQHTFPRLQDEKPQSLCQYSGKVVLVVNTASFCGFTPQYKGLEALDSKYRARGLVVLGFPSNDFAQESASNKEIADFCESTFGVKFPMFGKSSVRGSDANPLFKQLAQASGTTPKWNFYKYLIGRDGKVVQAWSSMTAPDENAFIAIIEKQLAANPG
ncbi:glutathione peroxidase [Variovorax paradoxus]|uniref:glutathione peroxidase n=1 Tax=Variovorax paradoxus TaxID=34073 RepID=UPI0006E6DC4A|nr:glutathione peroxidase [Variovorax paradoxus]KPU88843.1 glutathione peroxidase [Variovorax paradoxus]KPU92232.1 glutathione peroxidase [Variovorax paradoxus]KPV05919.1 glutathione peroxidase [Variovorax paradoxus]KPV16219.1 glutathione peroxidase [Variovorax paradoxus]